MNTKIRSQNNEIMTKKNWKISHLNNGDRRDVSSRCTTKDETIAFNM
jgi:hypothetical protein